MNIRLARAQIAVVVVCATGGVTAATAQAECLNETIRKAESHGSGLPECRAYEQVSQVDKNATDALGGPGFVESSPDGKRVTFFSASPFPSIPGVSEVPGSAEYPTYLSSRGATWTTQGLIPASDPGTDNSPVVLGVTEDLRGALISASEPKLAEEAPGGRASYLRDNVTNTFKWLPGPASPVYADSTPDGLHILIEATAEELIPGIVDEEGEPFLYEWDRTKPVAEQLSFVGMVEGAAPKTGTVAGTGPAGGAGFYAANTISEDGSRVFFTDKDNGRVYVREPESGTTTAVSGAEATWRASTPDGHYAFYTEGGALYRFDVVTATREPITSGAAAVLGTLGVSDDGATAYFTAEGALASGATVGHANLYEWHEGSLVYLAGLRLGSAGDETDWTDRYESGGAKSARVTPSGQTLLFSSREQLGSYENRAHDELYRFERGQPVSATNPACVSCQPSGAPAVSAAQLLPQEPQLTPGNFGLFLTRNLSEDGSRIFFQTTEALVPSDVNGTTDVYEWARLGASACTPGAPTLAEATGGCLLLLSSGQGAEGAVFGDASANGGDVFLFTRQRLVRQDQDDNADLYDVRVDGGLPAQNPAGALPPCEAESCRAPLVQPAEPPTPASSGLSGGGNLAPPSVAAAPPNPKPPLTRAQKLAVALKACKRKRRATRHGCETQARKRYGPAKHAKRATGRRTTTKRHG